MGDLDLRSLDLERVLLLLFLSSDLLSRDLDLLRLLSLDLDLDLILD